MSESRLDLSLRILRNAVTATDLELLRIGFNPFTPANRVHRRAAADTTDDSELELP